MADNDDDSSSDCPLHKCVFLDDIRKLSQLLRLYDVAQRDKHGNTLKLIKLIENCGDCGPKYKIKTVAVATGYTEYTNVLVTATKRVSKKCVLCISNL